MTEIVKKALGTQLSLFYTKDLKRLVVDDNKRACQLRRAVLSGDFERVGRGLYYLNPTLARTTLPLSETELYEELKKIADFLVEKGATHVYLFGSYLKGEATGKSDIDIGVRGLPPKIFLSVWSALENESSKKIDLIDFDFSKDFFCFLSEANSVKLIGGSCAA